MNKLITQAEYARLRGVSRVAVGKAVKAHRIDLVDGLIDPSAADAQWERNTRKAVGRGGRPAMDKLLEIWKNAPPADRNVESLTSGAQVAGDSQPQTPYDYETSRAKREHHEAELAMMRAQERARQLVETSQVLAAVDHITSLLCEGLDSLPTIIAARINREMPQAQLHQVLEAAVLEARMGFIEAVERLANPKRTASPVATALVG